MTSIGTSSAKSTTFDQIEESRLGPVNVFEDEQERLPLRQRLQKPAGRGEDFFDRRNRLAETDRAQDSLGDPVSLVGFGENFEKPPLDIRLACQLQHELP
jgi:hypothetical protein